MKKVIQDTQKDTILLSQVKSNNIVGLKSKIGQKMFLIHTERGYTLVNSEYNCSFMGSWSKKISKKL